MSAAGPVVGAAGGVARAAVAGPGCRGRVLLAEDDPAAARALADPLRAAGFHVQIAESGREALRRLCAHRFDLLICDIVLPGLDGLELLQWRLRLQAALPAIALSGDGPEAGQLYAKAALCFGADLALTKPADPRCVLAEAHRLTGHHRGVPAPEREAAAQKRVAADSRAIS